MSNAPLMLGVSGLRGIAGASLTAELAVRYAGTVGTLLKERARKRTPRVVVGYDGRVGGEVWYSAAIAGLLSSGCDVVPAGVAMTPSMGVAADALGADAAMQVTASHNPQEWNGLKILIRAKSGAGKVDACAPPKSLAAEIVERFGAGRIASQTWEGLGAVVGKVDSGEGHRRLVMERLSELVPVAKVRRRKLRVVLDSVNGAGGVAGAAMLAEDLGCAVTALGKEPGKFWHIPEPIEPNLGAVARRVKKAKATAGFCQDPDADRLALIDERGRFIGEEYTLVLAAEALGRLGVITRGSTLAVNLSTSRMIEDVAARFGARVVRTAVGEANVVEAMKARRSPLGGEGNGGVIWPAVTYVRDSLGAMGLVMALLTMSGQTVSELVAALPAYAILKRKVDLARKEDAAPGLQKLRSAYASERVDTQDGVRVDFESRRAWVHVRASNTEPILRLIAEAPTREQAAGLLDEAARVIA